MFFGLKVHGVEPKVIVCDGQKGLIKAIHEVWPQTIIQRCLIHISRQAKAWLTQNPKAEAGQELRLIVKKLTDIETETEKIIWLKSFDDWQKKYDYFLKEKTRHPIMEKNWWYTHKKLRAIRSLLKNSLDNLFVYLNDPRVPKTSNDVEGGINSRIKDLLRIHRGLIPKHQQVLASWYLAKRQGQKPTRNFH
jgi:transposase-like protein